MQLALLDDREIIIAEASKRVGARLPAGSTINDRIARYDALRAYDSLRGKITAHGGYIGPDNKQSTTLTGFSITINKMIKKVFGKPVGSMTTERDLIALTRIREAVSLAISRGERLELTRRNIKDKIQATIEQCYEIYGE